MKKLINEAMLQGHLDRICKKIQAQNLDNWSCEVCNKYTIDEKFYCNEVVKYLAAEYEKDFDDIEVKYEDCKPVQKKRYCGGCCLFHENMLENEGYDEWHFCINVILEVGNRHKLFYKPMQHEQLFV